MTDFLMDASARVAFVALLHDLGKFAQRAKIDIPQYDLDGHVSVYCPYNQEKGYHTHKHAAYTGYGMDLIEKYVPELIEKDTYPFAHRKNDQQVITDSMINAAAAHHKPESFLQWIIAIADRVSSGFERETFAQYNLSSESEDNNKETGRNFYQARLLTLFEQIQLSGQRFKYCYPLQPLSAQSIFPKKRSEYEPDNDEKAQNEYKKLWEKFIEGLEDIPKQHRNSWELWLDHFDSLWQCYTSFIPSATAFGVKPDVSLYDHSKATTALATALWRWHEENKKTDEEAIISLKNKESWDINKFLLIQGDFFGIQDFIFSSGSEVQTQIAKLLRGRSFQVSLFTELAALKILQACSLPSTSQIVNAAGKFLIVAPNTDNVRQAIKKVQLELNDWFIQNTYGLVGLGIATCTASCLDFTQKNFKNLIKKLFKELDKVKLQRLDLINQSSIVLPVTYPYGVCKLNKKLPAKNEEGLSVLSLDQISIGNNLVDKSRLLILKGDSLEIYENNKTQMLSLPIFGYKVLFTKDDKFTGKFSELVLKGNLQRCWDFSIPKDQEEGVWKGYAHRYINTYIPRFSENDNRERYIINGDIDDIVPGSIKPFDYIACENREKDQKTNSFQGQVALMTLKGDVDDLGNILKKGLENPTFAKMASLSRQINLFFSLWLPVYCQKYYKNSYTVFAGGDDFFLIGPWYSTQKLAESMYEKFASYVADNPNIHFSAGMVMSKLGLPITKLGNLADKSLEQSKNYTSNVRQKNAVTIYNQTVSWEDFRELNKLEEEIEELFEAENFNISTSYLYSLIKFSEQSSSDKLEDSMWRSRLYYKTTRYVKDNIKGDLRTVAMNKLIGLFGNRGIGNWKIKFIIPLFNYFYQRR
ncbi:type III-A CRISPR-associated protein Cas10/Csm1 [Gallibacterium anatis]|uniref:type III-A CRISPR-associated protein Cas10/Csm1 n=1 Tax=Gallibacterium anatis TaxID=750 RepID=UPI0039FC4467